ncbi:adenylate kinase 8 [Trichonephila clavata]|uniref:Adenylate kinase 8 n=1 Tax=Trichonephila clavata TaxID=2740835 RepID=A0A8X6FDN7_TRICU|nr:adenylate kinase 8 [Trichonephila clavata]
MKERVEQPDCVKNGWLMEAFPKTRFQAFALRKIGVFPTHIVVIDDPVITQRVTLRSHPEISDILSEEGLQEMLDYLGHVDLILDLHSNSYAKKFQIGKMEDAERSIEKVIEFVRSRKRPAEPYLPRVLMFGPYGSGISATARRLVQKYQLVEVPDELLVQVASERLIKEDCIKSGWIMYNFPDTKEQVELLMRALEGFQVNRVIFFDVPLETCLERMEPRRWDPTTGEMYHLKLRPCTERKALSRLIQLPEDSEDSIKADHELYSTNSVHLNTSSGPTRPRTSLPKWTPACQRKSSSNWRKEPS